MQPEPQKLLNAGDEIVVRGRWRSNSASLTKVVRTTQTQATLINGTKLRREVGSSGRLREIGGGTCGQISYELATEKGRKDAAEHKMRTMGCRQLEALAKEILNASGKRLAAIYKALQTIKQEERK